MNRIPHSSRTMRLFGILCLLISATAALAQTNTPDIRKLSLEDCLEIALHHNLDIQIRRYDPEISAFALGGLYGAYDTAIYINGNHSDNQQPGSVDTQGRAIPGAEIQSDNYS